MSGLKSGLFNKPYISIDIETTSRDATTGKIWNIGFVTNNGNEGDLFLSPNRLRKPSKQTVEQMKALMSEGKFNQRQLAAGKYASYFAALEAGQTLGSESANVVMRNLARSIPAGGFFLIQNAFFENKFFANAANRAGVYKGIADRFEFVSTYTNGASGFLYTPPQVTTQRSLGTRAYESFLMSHTNKHFEDTVKHYRAMMNEYMDISAKATKPFVVDLMDITKATYALAASQGLIDKTNIHMGTGIEFLAHHLLGGEKEEHLGLSDAKQQSRIAEKLVQMYDDMSTGTLGAKDVEIFGNIAKAQEAEHGRQLIKALKTGLEESISPSGYKKFMPRSIKKIDRIVDSQGNKTPALVYRASVPDWEKHLITTNDADIAISDIVHNARKRLRLKEDHIDGILDNLGKIKSTQGKIDYLYELEEAYKEGGPLPSAGGMGEVEDGIFSKIKNKWNGLSGGKKLLLGGAAVAAMYLNMSDSYASQNNIKAIKRKREMRERTQDLDSNIRMYSRIDNYHGSGFATWNDRTKHHEY